MEKCAKEKEIARAVVVWDIVSGTVYWEEPVSIWNKGKNQSALPYARPTQRPPANIMNASRLGIHATSCEV